MVYKFLVGSEEAENFKLEIAIDSEDTFLRLRNAILDAAGYSKDQMDSFYICDEDWVKEKEVTFIDMGTDSDEDIWLMEDTPLAELIEDEGQKLKFVFDYVTERYFFMKLNEVVPGKTLHDPLCQRKEGKAPKENIDFETFSPAAVKVVDTSLDDLDAEGATALAAAAGDAIRGVRRKLQIMRLQGCGNLRLHGGQIVEFVGHRDIDAGGTRLAVTAIGALSRAEGMLWSGRES